MNVVETALPGVLIIEPQVYTDNRGFFLETFNDIRYPANTMPQVFVQDNLSRSEKGVLRGLHYQLEKPQGKLVWVTRGAVFDVAVDVRANSETFGQYVGVILDDDKHRQFYIPPGFAHGFCVLSEQADFVYKCTDYYHPQSEKGILWNDPTIKIEWPIANPLISDKDRQNRLLSDLLPNELPRL